MSEVQVLRPLMYDRPMWSGFGGFSELDFGDTPPTWPAIGSATLIVEDKYEPLFFSATWTIRARVGDVVISETRPADQPHTDPFVKRWARQFIRTKHSALRRLGVDADAEYVKWGGVLDDLR